MYHPNLTNSEIALINTFNANNGAGLRIGYAPRKQVFTLTDINGREPRLVASHADSWDLENIALRLIAEDVELLEAA